MSPMNPHTQSYTAFLATEDAFSAPL